MEIIDKLKNLGMSHKQCIVSKYIPYIFVNRGFYSTNDFGADEKIEGAIDCGTNEDLFLAIAALRDDTDKNQWFVNENKSCWWKCQFDSFKQDFKESNEDMGYIHKNFHKATVQELIEHFKNK